MNKNEMYRIIPKIDVLLKDEKIAGLTEMYGQDAVVETLQDILSQIREEARALADGEGRPANARTDLQPDMQPDVQPDTQSDMQPDVQPDMQPDMQPDIQINTHPGIQAGAEKIRQALEGIAQETDTRLKRLFSPHIIPVINGTGIILHTGLGRAPLGEKAVCLARRAADGYCSLEYDLKTGERGERCAHLERLLCRITGAEAVLVVNNNAAAVLLILSALAKGGEAVVSRGELVEIGGKFRIPDVMELSGARLRETGTTNRTRLSDYEEAVNEDTKVLLKVHTSNYRIVGFTESVSLHELCVLGKSRGICVAQDLGSGVLLDLSGYGRSGEPTVQESVAAGADVVCFSGDKLLGGPQAGIIVGRKCFLDRMKRHPLARAMRIDKFTAAALEQVLLEYLNPEQAVHNIPVLRMLTRPAGEVRRDAEMLAGEIRRRLENGKEPGDKPDMKESVGNKPDWKEPGRRKPDVQIKTVGCMSQAGGGALPGEEIDSFAVSILPGEIHVSELQRRLRNLQVPVLGRIVKERFLLDMRTVDGKNLNYLAETLSREELYSA